MKSVAVSKSSAVLFSYKGLLIVLTVAAVVTSQLKALGLNAYLIQPSSDDSESTAPPPNTHTVVAEQPSQESSEKGGGIETMPPTNDDAVEQQQRKRKETKHIIAPPTKKPNRDLNLTDFLDESLQDLGWENDEPPEWLADLCPEVVEHYTRFPSFRTLLDYEAPFMTTTFAAQSVCTLKVVKMMAASLNSHLYLHAGSQLGAILHGQPIPWDDDVDAIMDYRRKDDLLAMCDNTTDGGLSIRHDVKVHCNMHWNSIKIWLQPDHVTKKTTSKGFDHFSPFVDLFMFNITIKNGTEGIQEVMLRPRPRWTGHMKWFAITKFFPSQPYYLGGIYILGPPAEVAHKRYKYDICITSVWNHRLERRAKPRHSNKRMDCKQLQQYFPFQPNPPASNFVTNGVHSQSLLSLSSTTIDYVITNTTAKHRERWYQQVNDTAGQDITNQELGDTMNQVEVDNSISPYKECNSSNLKVVEFNAERGRWWLEASSQINVLKEADVIILNEMDIGMARSDLQHTTRQMAYFLSMNYAWGLEFVELTVGDKDDRNFLPDRLTNTQALHGNAILTKCGAIQDAIIFRNEIGEYFSSGKKKSVNAYGLEKRLGGRMGMFGRIMVNQELVVVGSVHKLGESGQYGYGPEIKEYIGASKAVVAGDQAGSFCKTIGLKKVVPPQDDHSGNTWPASCDVYGRLRGDNICTNMEEVEGEVTTKPCMKEYGLGLQISDHALTSIVLAVASSSKPN